MLIDLVRVACRLLIIKKLLKIYEFKKFNSGGMLFVLVDIKMLCSATEAKTQMQCEHYEYTCIHFLFRFHYITKHLNFLEFANMLSSEQQKVKSFAANA